MTEHEIREWLKSLSAVELAWLESAIISEWFRRDAAGDED